MDILENSDDFFKIHAYLKDINENTNIIVDNLKHYTEDKDKKTVKRTENIIARFKNADSLLICNKEKISALLRRGVRTYSWTDYIANPRLCLYST